MIAVNFPSTLFWVLTEIFYKQVIYISLSMDYFQSLMVEWLDKCDMHGPVGPLGLRDRSLTDPGKEVRILFLRRSFFCLLAYSLQGFD